MKELKDFRPDEFVANRDTINSLIMEQASDCAVRRMEQAFDLPFEAFVEPDIEDGEEVDEDTPTRYKTEYQEQYNRFYDEEYDRIATKHLQNKIENLFRAYMNEHNEEPRYASCCIKYLDNSPFCDVMIKLNVELDVKDDLLFYYCNSLNDLKSLCEFGTGDFILTEVYEFLNEI